MYFDSFSDLWSSNLLNWYWTFLSKSISPKLKRTRTFKPFSSFSEEKSANSCACSKQISDKKDEKSLEMSGSGALEKFCDIQSKIVALMHNSRTHVLRLRIWAPFIVSLLINVAILYKVLDFSKARLDCSWMFLGSNESDLKIK